MKKQTLIIALAITALFAATASAGSDYSVLNADNIDNQLVGMEPVGRTLSADELEFGTDADTMDYWQSGPDSGARTLPCDELDFDYSADH